jgi:hypothetical protein
MKELEELDPANFERKEWVALAWARDFTLFGGETPDDELQAEFESLYTEQQRRDIRAIITLQEFGNKFMNTLTGEVLEDPAARLEAD